jgi:hypothetical protein
MSRYDVRSGAESAGRAVPPPFARLRDRHFLGFPEAGSRRAATGARPSRDSGRDARATLEQMHTRTYAPRFICGSGWTLE